MDRELFVTVSDERYKVFLKDGFFEVNSKLTDFFHQHNYSEIHMIVKGCAILIINDDEIQLNRGDIILIPSGIMHRFTDFDDCVSVSFQIQVFDSKFNIIKLDSNIPEQFVTEIENVKNEGDFNRIQAYLGLFCTLLLQNKRLEAKKITNYEFIIHEFFNLNYNKEIKLSDLANELHLSDKQTERLILKYTGNTFKKELIKRRTEIAKHMSIDGNMSFKEIAEYVGYQSYSGFWKIYKNN